MPVPEQPPGVEIEEVGGHIITGVPTAICAFVGSCAQGPVEDPVRVTSYPEFEGMFGGLSSDSGLGYAVQDFFANGGGSAIILRLVAKDGVLTETDYVGAGFEDADKGIYALAKVAFFTLLCLPPPVPGGDLPQNVWKAALAL